MNTSTQFFPRCQHPAAATPAATLARPSPWSSPAMRRQTFTVVQPGHASPDLHRGPVRPPSPDLHRGPARPCLARPAPWSSPAMPPSTLPRTSATVTSFWGTSEPRDVNVSPALLVHTSANYYLQPPTSLPSHSAYCYTIPAPPATPTFRVGSAVITTSPQSFPYTSSDQ